MTDIYIPRTREIVLPSAQSIRFDPTKGPDAQDTIEYSNRRFAAMAQHVDAVNNGRAVILDGNAIGGNGSTYQMTPTKAAFASIAGSRPVGNMAHAAYGQPGTPGCPPSPRDGGTPNPPCEPIKHCGVTPLGMNTFGNANYPLAGVVAGTITEGAALEITSGRSGGFQAAWIFVAARDQAAGFARTLGFLTRATVNENSQLSGDSLVNRPIPTDVFEDVGPLPLDDWRQFTNTAPNTLFVTFGNGLGAAVSLQFDGLLWGSADGRGVAI